MSKFSLSKASVIAIGLSILATSTIIVFAQDDLPVSTKVKPERISAPALLNGNKPILQRFTSLDIENKLAGMKEKLASREAMLKAKLQTFRDQRKATAAARISTNLNKINQNQTTIMQRYLDIMSGILDKLEIRINNATPDIKDPVAAKAAVASARNTIATASAAVAAQTQKDYTIQISSEGRVRIDAQTMRNNLHTDILALRKIVIDAKQAVANVIKVSKPGSEVSTELKVKEGTISGKQ